VKGDLPSSDAVIKARTVAVNAKSMGLSGKKPEYGCKITE
jgi:hypothetical protein